VIEIQVVNNLTRRKEALRTIEPGHVRMYACGVTTYDHCHVGHAMQAIYWDIIRRYLEFAGYRVTYVRNYTDVDDKIINRAKERGISPAALAEDMVQSSERDMAEVGVKPPHHAPRVSHMIPQIIAMIEQLIQNGAAYATSDGDVFYRVSAKSDYGKLSNTKVSELRTGTRDIAGGKKEDELDFALWKSDQAEGASWSSPWGLGRPGWHIECSAMAKELLGPSFDIHGGGRDLIFPHHENEIAQSESANKAPFASYWLHSGLLTINRQKMSKSLGNHLMISDFLQEWPPEVLRISILQHHYSSNIDFSNQVFAQGLSRLLYYYRTIRDLQKFSSGAPASAGFEQTVVADFNRCMSDDFNTAAALGDMNKHFRAANELVKKKRTPENQQLAARYQSTFQHVLGSVFGLLAEDPDSFIDTLRDRALRELNMTRTQVEERIRARRSARDQKDFAQADAIRKELAEKGIELMDGVDGTDWTIRTSES
jgi:cysteinyl-tRNA synthetase